MGKPCAYIGQELKDHLINTLSLSTHFINENNWVNMTYHRIKFVLPNLEFSKDDILFIIKVGCLLHDIGKASKIYQDQFDNECNNVVDRVTFKFHEVPSSYIAYKLLVPIYGDILANLSSLAILLHIIRSENPLISSKDKLRHYHIWDLSSYYEYLNSLLPLKLDTSLLKIRYDEAFNHIQMLKDFVERKPIISKLHVLFLTPVIVGDNLDAFNRAGGEGKSPWRLMFVNQLKEALGGGS